MDIRIQMALHLAVMSAGLKSKGAQRADCLACWTTMGALTDA